MNARRVRHDNTPDAEPGPEAAWVERAIGIVATVLGFAFAVGKIRATPNLSLADHTWSTFFLNAAAVFYYFAWIWGGRSDLQAQQSATRRLARHRWELRVTLITFLAVLATLFVILTRTTSVTTFLSVVVAILIWDVLAWRVFVRRTLIPQFVHAQRLALSENDVLGSLDVAVVQEYMTAGWRLSRWAFAFVAAAALIVIDRVGLAQRLPHTVWLSHVFSGESLLAFGVLAYLLVLEAWIWYYRLHRNACRRALANHEEQVPDTVRHIWAKYLLDSQLGVERAHHRRT